MVRRETSVVKCSHMVVEFGGGHPIEGMNAEAKRERVETRPDSSSVSHEPLSEKVKEQRRFMREREITIAQIRTQIAQAQAEQVVLEEDASRAAEEIGTHEEAVRTLKKGPLGWLTSRLQHADILNEHNEELIKERARLAHARKQKDAASRYEAGLKTHLDNLLRKHDVDRAALNQAFVEEESDEALAAK